MHADWGPDEGWLTDPWPTEPLPPERLPAVVAARTDGWFLAPDAPVWAFLPAVWPVRARAWVPDRSVRHTRLRSDSGDDAVIAWSPWDFVQVEHDLNHMLMAAGVPSRPPGRLWLLKPPAPFEHLDDAVEAIAAGVRADGIVLTCSTELVTWTHAVVARWFAAHQ